MSKQKNYAVDRRVQRRRESGSEVKHDIMLGRTARRKWGGGAVKK